MPAATDMMIEAAGGRRRPLIWNSVTPGAVTVRHIELLTKILGRLGSDHDGERAVAAALADRFIKQIGHTWESLLAPLATAASDTANDTDPAYWARVIRELQAARPPLLHRDAEFLATVARWVACGKVPSEKQQRWIRDIAARAL